MMGILPHQQQYDAAVMQYNSAVGSGGQQYGVDAAGQYAVETRMAREMEASTARMVDDILSSSPPQQQQQQHLQHLPAGEGLRMYNMGGGAGGEAGLVSAVEAPMLPWGQPHQQQQQQQQQGQWSGAATGGAEGLSGLPRPAEDDYSFLGMLTSGSRDVGSRGRGA